MYQPKKTFKNLKEFIQELPMWKHNELFTIPGTSSHAIKRAINGTSKPSIQFIVALALVWEVDIRYIFNTFPDDFRHLSPEIIDNATERYFKALKQLEEKKKAAA